MDSTTQRRVALMKRYSAIPFEMVMFLNKLNKLSKDDKKRGCGQNEGRE